MADEDENNENAEGQELPPVDENEEDEDAPKPEVTHVTRIQWTFICVLGLLILYILIIWPRAASDKQVLKDAGLYIKQAQENFSLAHLKYTFPKLKRIFTYQQVVWNYEAAKRAGHEYMSDDLYRWGYAHYQLAEDKYNFADLSLVPPIRLLRKSLSMRNAESEASEEKTRYLLGLSYLKIGNPSEAIKQLEILRNKKWELESYYRRLRKNKDIPIDPPPFELDATPYHLQLSELYQVDLLLGQAYYIQERLEDASATLKDYMESTRSESLQRNMTEQMIEPDNQARFNALNLLGEIYWKTARKTFVDIKKSKAARKPVKTIVKLKDKWQRNLQLGHQYLSEALRQEYTVFDNSTTKLRLAELAFQLGYIDETLSLSKNFSHHENSMTKAMNLWKIQAMLKKDPYLSVDATLTATAGAGSFVSDDIKLAALVLLGEAQTNRGDLDLPLGELVPQEVKHKSSREVGVYLQAANRFSEETFEENPIIDKLTLINHTMQRAMAYRNKSDEDTAIGLYSFLLEHFSIPQADTLHQIGFLKRIRAKEMEEEDGMLSDRAREAYRHSGEFFLKAINKPYSPKAQENIYFEAAESFYLGHFYARAYDLYGKFIKLRSNDKRVSQARHMRGLSALHRRRETRFQEAIYEFMSNISKNVRPVYDNLTQPADIANSSDGGKVTVRPEQIKIEADMLKSVLGNINMSSRDLWAYSSFLELGNAYYAQHKYDFAKQVYDAILRDPTFTPQSEIWRKAAFHRARLSYDEAYESLKKVKPWPQAIGRLDDFLLRYDIGLIKSDINDPVLLAQVKDDNAKIKFMLASAYFKSYDYKESIRHCRELIEKPDDFTQSRYDLQRTRAMLADGLYQLKRYGEAYEQYRLAHDRNLESYERPFYSINMADCLIGDGRIQQAINLLKRTRWEFDRLFTDKSMILEYKDQKLDKQTWLKFVDSKIKGLQNRGA